MAYEIELVEVPPAWIASVRRRVPWAELGRVLPELSGQVEAWLGAAGERARAGRRIVVYHQPTADDVEVECGVRIAEPLEGAPRPIRCARAPAGRALRVIHRGPSAELGRAHDALVAACRERGYPEGVRWEVHADPGGQGDPARREAEVYASIEPNAAQLAYWNGPNGDRWSQTWEMIDRSETEITEALFELAAPRAGERVLDVGCGAGSTTLALRERVGAGGAATGIDISAPMLAVARARAAGTDVTFVEADASSYAFRPEHDLVCSRFGVMFFADPAAAFANLRRAAAAGGRLAFVCWRTADDNALFTVPLGAARDLVPDAAVPPPHLPGPFAFVDPDRLRGFLDRAGWRDLAIARRDLAMRLGRTVEEAAGAAMMMGPLAKHVVELAEDARARVRDRLIDALAPFGTPEGVALPVSCWLVAARA